MSAPATTTVDPSIGVRIDHYRLQDRIGGGATSSVYAAIDERTGQRVALKMIATDLEDEPETRERFFREARITATLTDPHIVTMLGVGEDHGRPYLAMEYLTGLPLKEYLLQETAQSLDARLNLMMQLCQGLQAAHDRNVVHRDIKPSNLFVTSDGCLKILDFGLARLQASTLTAQGQILGTPEFMSPEQAEGRRVDARSDIFSAASVSYFMLIGRAPFTGASLRETLTALLGDAPVPMPAPAIPRALGRVLRKGLAKRPEARYQRSTDMFEDLARVRQASGRHTFWQRLASLVGKGHV